MLKNSKLFYFCHLKKLVRPETFGPYYVRSTCIPAVSPLLDKQLGTAVKNISSISTSLLWLTQELWGPRLLSRYSDSLIRLDGPGNESRWKQNFSHPSRPALGPIQPHVQWVPDLFPRGKAAGA